MILRIVILSLICMPAHAWFEHGRAVDAARNDDWQRAHSLLTMQLVDHPDDAAVVYDAGVAAYKVGDHNQAHACFEQVIASPRASDQQKELAYFNRGNTQVALKKLEDAINSYECALRIDAHDERAKHNLKIVKKMLEEQKQQEKNQDEQSSCAKAPADTNKEKKEQQDKQQQDNNQGQTEQDEQQGGSDEQQGEGKQDQDNKQSDTKNGQSEKDQKQKQEQERSGNSRKNEQERRDADRQAQKERAEQAEKKQKESAGVNEANGKKETEKKEMSQAQQSTSKLDKQLRALLEQQEKHDAQINKQMIKATVGTQMGDKHDKNCW